MFLTKKSDGKKEKTCQYIKNTIIYVFKLDLDGVAIIDLYDHSRSLCD
jgi:hypothetical protein